MMFFVLSSLFYVVTPSEARNLSSVLAAANNDLRQKRKKGTP